MKQITTHFLAKCVLLPMALFATVFSVGCGSGGGSDVDLELQPAPTTLDGVELTLWQGGPVLGFRRTSASFRAEQGQESGVMFMVDGPDALNLGTRQIDEGTLDTIRNDGPNAITIDGSRTDVVLQPAAEVFSANYTYNRIESRVGEIFVRGVAGLIPASAELGQVPIFFGSFGPTTDFTFEHTFRIEFGSTGQSVTNVTSRLIYVNERGAVIQVQDNSVTPAKPLTYTSDGFDSTLFLDSSIRLLNGQGPLPVGYDARDAELRDFVQVFPLALDDAEITFTPAVGDPLAAALIDPSDPDNTGPFSLRFFRSDFIPDLERGGFNESGTVFDSNPDNPRPLGSYLYIPGSEDASDFRSTLTLRLTNRPDITPTDAEFILQFASTAAGDYTNDLGGSGTFSINFFLIEDPFGQ